MLWRCPNCHKECETAFCPDCGYQCPNQRSEVDAFAIKVRKANKRMFLWFIPSILVLISLTVLFFVHKWFLDVNGYWLYIFQNPEKLWVFITLFTATLAIVTTFFAIRKTTKLLNDVVTVLDATRRPPREDTTIRF